MAWSLIAAAAAQQTTSAVDTTGANLLVVVTGDEGFSVSDSKGNTWTLAVQAAASGSPYSRIYYCYNPTVGSGHTFTVGLSYGAIAVAAYSGSDSSPLDQTGATATGALVTTFASGNITPTTDNQLVVSGIGVGKSANTLTIGSGMSVAASKNAATGVTYGAAIAWIAQTTAAAINPSWSWTSSGEAASPIASFKMVAGGGTVTLAAQDAAHAHALDNAALSIGVTLTVADLAHGHALDASTLSTGTALAVADAQHAHALDNVTLSTTGATSLTVADLLHAHTLDAVVLTSQTDLAAADMAHGHALDGVTLTLGGISLVIAEIMHAHALDNVALTLDTYLAVADILHAHTIDNVLVSIPGGTLDLILKILRNRQELNPTTGKFTLYDDDGVTVLYTTSAWADAAGTVPYSGGALRRIDALF